MSLEHQQKQVKSLFAPWDGTDGPGLVVGIARHGEVIYRRAFGMASLETRSANELTTRMRIGSTSKHFLALAALLLQEDGKLALDNCIGRYLPELKGLNGKPTLRQLLQHRGGTRCHIDLGFIGHGMLAAPVGSALETLVSQSGVNFSPGEAMIYNNGGYHLVSLVISRVTGMPIADVLRERLFEPLGMRSTALVTSDYVITPGMAGLHVRSPDNSWRRGLFPSREILGEGGIVSTVDDMLAWAMHLRSRQRFGTPDTWRELTTVPLDPNGGPGYYGLGVVVSNYRGIETLRHPGGVVGGASEMICAPASGIDVVVLSNGAKDAAPAYLAQGILDILLADTLEPPPATSSADQYVSHLGDYVSEETGMLYGLEAEGGALLLRVAKYPSATPLETCDDGWLQTGMTGLGRIRVRPAAEDPNGLILEFGASRERHVRIRTESNMTLSAAQIEGRYRSDESGIGAEIRATNTGLLMRTWDYWGSTEFDLIELGGRWFHMRSKYDPEEFSGVVHFPKGNAEGFRLNSARTRNLSFSRKENFYY